MDVDRAKADLAAAQAEQKEQERKHDLSVLSLIRQERELKIKQLQELVTEIQAADGERAVRQQRVDHIVEQMEKHAATKPDVFDMLPDDPAVTRWQSRQNYLVAERAKAVAFRNAVQLPDRMIAIKLDARITEIDRSERNLVMKIRGEIPTQGKSSLNYVR